MKPFPSLEDSPILGLFFLFLWQAAGGLIPSRHIAILLLSPARPVPNLE